MHVERLKDTVQTIAQIEGQLLIFEDGKVRSDPEKKKRELES